MLDPSKIMVVGNVGQVFVSHSGRQKAVLFDAEDIGVITSYHWGQSGRYVGCKKIGTLHRFLVKAPKGKEVDHINGDPFDNRKSNLRVCTRAGNMRNRRKSPGATSRFKGVSWDSHKRKWRGCIQQRKLGYFTCEIDAARAYDRAAVASYGAFARTNEMEGLL